MFFDMNYLIYMTPGLLLMLWAQNKVKGSYAKYSKIANDDRLTGAQVARRILDANGLQNVGIQQVPGELSDHYDPSKRMLSLSPGVYQQASVAAMAVAAHEVGHAIQHRDAYVWLTARTAIVPAVNIGSNLGIFVLIAGLMLANQTMAWVGVGLFALSTLFALVTLPVEFDASNRAKAQLQNLGMVGVSEAKGVADMLSAAAWTYVASFAASLLTLLYYVSLVSGSGRSRD